MAKTRRKKRVVKAKRKPKTLGAWLRKLGVCQENLRRYGKLSLKKAIRLADRRNDWRALWSFMPPSWESFWNRGQEENKAKILAEFAKWKARGK